MKRRYLLGSKAYWLTEAQAELLGRLRSVPGASAHVGGSDLLPARALAALGLGEFNGDSLFLSAEARKLQIRPSLTESP